MQATDKGARRKTPAFSRDPIYVQFAPFYFFQVNSVQQTNSMKPIRMQFTTSCPWPWQLSCSVSC